MLKISNSERQSKLILLEGRCPQCKTENSSVVVDYFHHKRDKLQSIIKIKCFVCGTLHKMKFRDLINGEEQNDDN